MKDPAKRDTFKRNARRVWNESETAVHLDRTISVFEVKSERMYQRTGLLVPENAQKETYVGMVEIRGHTFPIRVSDVRDGGRDFRVASIRCGESLSNLLLTSSVDKDRALKFLKTRVSKCTNADQIVSEIEDIVERTLTVRGSLPSETSTTAARLPPASYFSKVLQDIKSISWKNVIYIDESSLSNVRIRVNDSSGREHVADVRFPNEYPNVAAECFLDLPGKPRSKLTMSKKWSPETSGLVDIVRSAIVALDTYDALWKELEDIDHNTWILEPEHPNRSHTYRRLVVARFCSLQVNLDIISPRRLCEWRFMGAEKTVAPLRRKLQERVGQRWDDRRGIRTNLQDILEIVFPSPSTSERSEFASECGICYSHRLRITQRADIEDGAEPRATAHTKTSAPSVTPEVACENEKCGRLFHAKCLSEWLQSIPSVRRSFGTLFGKCPYCSTAIAVQFAGG